MSTTVTGLVLGLLLGMRHALEPDHLTAVSTLATENASGKRGALLGAFWGVGHSFALLVVGIVLTALHAEMPSRLADMFEMGVGAMLVVLGLRAVIRSRRLMTMGEPRPHAHRHRHHSHGGHHAHVHLGKRAFASRALVVGMVHGLAGSGALTAMVLADLPSMASRLLYIVLFGAGSIFGMSLLSCGVGLPLARLGRHPRTRAILSAGAGAISVALGIAWIWPCAFRIARF